MLESLQLTPIWVYFLFIILLAIGIKQTQDRIATRIAIYFLPMALIFYSVLEMVTQIGMNWSTISWWLSGFFLSFSFFMSVLGLKNLTYDASTRRFFVPGSWLPLSIIMAIFFVKYIQGAVAALEPEMAKSYLFLWIFSFFNGIFCGIFSARILSFWKTSKAISS